MIEHSNTNALSASRQFGSKDTNHARRPTISKSVANKDDVSVF